MPNDKQFDVQGARKAGYSDDEIISHLATLKNFDLAGAKNAAYSTQDILYHLAPNQGLQFTDKVTGKGGLGAEGIPEAIWQGIKGLVPQDPTGGHPLLSKAAWLGPSGHIFSLAPNEESGIGKAFSEAKAGYARGGLPEAITSAAGALSPVPISASRAAQLASQGESDPELE